MERNFESGPLVFFYPEENVSVGPALGTYLEMPVEASRRQGEISGERTEVIGCHLAGGYLFAVGVEQLQFKGRSLRHHLCTVFRLAIGHSFHVNGLTRTVDGTVGQQRKVVTDGRSDVGGLPQVNTLRLHGCVIVFVRHVTGHVAFLLPGHNGFAVRSGGDRFQQTICVGVKINRHPVDRMPALIVQSDDLHGASAQIECHDSQTRQGKETTHRTPVLGLWHSLYNIHTRGDRHRQTENRVAGQIGHIGWQFAGTGQRRKGMLGGIDTLRRTLAEVGVVVAVIRIGICLQIGGIDVQCDRRVQCPVIYL